MLSINKDKNIELITKMFKFFEIEIENIDDLVGIEIERDILITKEAVAFLQSLQNSFKECGYKTGVLTALFKNNLTKQKWPALNMMRQILKCNNIRMQPLIKSNGYNKSTGKKNVIRSFVFLKLEQKD